MKYLSLAVLAVWGAGPVVAADVPALLTQKRCVACHDMSEARIGPPYAAIAVRHRANKDEMIEVLAQTVIAADGTVEVRATFVELSGTNRERLHELCRPDTSGLAC